MNRRILIVLSIYLMGVSLEVHADRFTEPRWWRSHGVLDATQERNDYVAVNQGQVKHVALAAHSAMEDRLPGGAGAELDALISGFSNSHNYNVVTVGQLKEIARPFYDRLRISYPWPDDFVEEDLRIVNVGQVKRLFSFRLPRHKKVSRQMAVRDR